MHIVSLGTTTYIFYHYYGNSTITSLYYSVKLSRKEKKKRLHRAILFPQGCKRFDWFRDHNESLRVIYPIYLTTYKASRPPRRQFSQRLHEPQSIETS